MDDDEIEERFNNATIDDDDIADTTTGDQETDTAEDTDASNTQAGDDQETDTETETETSGKPTPPSGDDTATEDEDDDDDDIDNFTPPMAQAAPQAGSTNFDIRTLPRNSDGTLDATRANEEIEKHINSRLEAERSSGEQLSQTRQALTTQWTRGLTKYPGVAKNKDLATLARDIHLNSIEASKRGEGQYLSPLAAIRKVDRMYRKAAKSGYQSAKSRTRIVKTTQTETTSGKDADGKPANSDYDKARKMARSTDPQTAKAGRMKVLEIRRVARESK